MIYLDPRRGNLGALHAAKADQRSIQSADQAARFVRDNVRRIKQQPRGMEETDACLPRSGITSGITLGFISRRCLESSHGQAPTRSAHPLRLVIGGDTFFGVYLLSTAAFATGDTPHMETGAKGLRFWGRCE